MNGAQEIDFEARRLAWIESQMPEEHEPNYVEIECECCGCIGEFEEDEEPMRWIDIEVSGKMQHRHCVCWVCEECIEEAAKDPDLQWEFFDTPEEREELKHMELSDRMEWCLDNRESFIDFLVKNGYSR